MPVAWNPKRWWNRSVTEDEKKINAYLIAV